MIFVILKNNYYENQAISTYPISTSEAKKDQAKESETLSAKPRWMNSRSSSMC